MNGLSMHELCDLWIGNDKFGMILACDLDEMVGMKVAWYWYEMKFYIHGLGWMSRYEFHMWHEWGLVTEIGMRFLCMIIVTWLF